MSEYNWTYGTVGERTRVRIQTGEDIRHLAELDEKLWSVLSCPVSGLEIPEASLKFIDGDGDGFLHVQELKDMSRWLCAVLRDPGVLFAGSEVLSLADIADEGILVRARAISHDGQTIGLAEVNQCIDGIKAEESDAPERPYDEDIISAFLGREKELADYFELEKLAGLGLAVIPADTPRPGMSVEAFTKMGKAIHDYQSEVSLKAEADASRLKEARSQYDDLLKLLLMSRDFCRILRNFVTFEDFYNRDSATKAMFQAGRLVIDQRICHLVIRVSDMSKHETQAEKSGMYLIYCDCKNAKLKSSMKIVAAVTVGEIRNLSVGKNAIFYDMQGNDWDATIYKIIDNPISIRQAFWSPYRKFGKWVTDLINKSAGEKDNKVFNDITAKVQETAKSDIKEPDKKSQFDIAKFAGIFAAIGMAIGAIGSFLVSVARGASALPWWQLLLCLFGILLLISGPSMVMAWIKIRNRNLAPLLNANGWAVNSDAIVSVIFGITLTEMAKFPIIKLHKVLSRSRKTGIVIALICLLFVMIGVVVLYRQGAIELFNK